MIMSVRVDRTVFFSLPLSWSCWRQLIWSLIQFPNWILRLTLSIVREILHQHLFSSPSVDPSSCKSSRKTKKFSPLSRPRRQFSLLFFLSQLNLSGENSFSISSFNLFVHAFWQAETLQMPLAQACSTGFSILQSAAARTRMKPTRRTINVSEQMFMSENILPSILDAPRSFRPFHQQHSNRCPTSLIADLFFRPVKRIWNRIIRHQWSIKPMFSLMMICPKMFLL